jgi:hypothetical protein
MLMHFGQAAAAATGSSPAPRRAAVESAPIKTDALPAADGTGADFVTKGFQEQQNETTNDNGDAEDQLVQSMGAGTHFYVSVVRTTYC